MKAEFTLEFSEKEVFSLSVFTIRIVLSKPLNANKTVSKSPIKTTIFLTKFIVANVRYNVKIAKFYILNER